MLIMLNGEQRRIQASWTITRLLEELSLTGARLAIEVNGEIVPRSEFVNHNLDEGDQVEIVRAIGGG